MIQMRMILEGMCGDNYLEFLLLPREVDDLHAKKIVYMEGEIGKELYQICVRSISPKELIEIEENEEDMPLIRGSSKETVKKNIEEMVNAGHPVKQAVAAAISMSRKKKGPKSKKMCKKEG